MAVSDVNFKPEEMDPFRKVSSVLEKVRTSKLDIAFESAQAKGSVLTRDYIEMVIEDYALAAQDQASFNKWVQLDTDIEKALKKFRSELAALLQGMSTAGVAAAQIQTETGAPTPTGEAPDLTANQLRV